jgi:uncharacterized protein with ParB-like and HNH nuclease domain
MDNNNNAILAKDYRLSEILSNKKYSVDYFQREYKWEQINIEQLVSDLVGAFMENYHNGDTIKDVAHYGTYYMGSIVLSERGSVNSIIDGQQRITSLTLLLIYLYHATEKTMSEQIANMIYSDSYGEKSFNIDVPERQDCLKSLYETGEYTVKDTDDESTKNMAERYNDICNCFPRDDFKGDMLKAFIYWVRENLILVKITAQSDENAYTIFETMNDRGVPLTASDMLKGFILSKFTHDDKRTKVNAEWRRDMLKLDAYDTNKGAENQFFQSWLRAQFAISIRPAKVNSVNQDFENIGTRYHNWFKDNYDKELLAQAIHGDIEGFIENNYRFFFKQFVKIKEAEKTFKKELEHVYYHQFWRIAPSLCYALYLAPLTLGDDEETCNKKIDMVAHYLENFAVRRSTNYRLFSASSIRYTMCNLVKTIRGADIEKLRAMLVKETEDIDDFDKSLPKFRLHGMNKSFIKYFLARLTSFVEEGSEIGNHFVEYMRNPNRKPFEVEHIWSEHFEMHTDEFEQKDDFNQWRNSIGDLILLPNGVNQSYNDMSVKKKLPHYIKENILAKSFCKGTYENNPSFIKFITMYKLPFKSYDDFKKKDIEERCLLYAEIAKLVWNKSLE